MSARRIEEVDDVEAFGSKAATLGAAARAGLPVPPGWALDFELVAAIARGDPSALEECASLFDVASGTSMAVRSSAAAEDGPRASFAGQYVTRLHVKGRASLIEAIAAVHASGHAAAAIAYRSRLGLDDATRMGVIVQQMVAADRAGVLFTRDPVTGADERVVEASWGLGETVVAGMVTPDRHRMRRGGEVIASELGDKEVELVAAREGGTMERPLEESRATRQCLDDDDLSALEDLAAKCERHFEGASDIEWAFEGRALFLLQRRPVTTGIVPART